MSGATRRARLRRALIGMTVLGALAIAPVGCGDSDGGESGGPSGDEAATAAAKRFLDEYMDPDGRVVRRDEGGDTVGEGQAYAMLAAVAIDDRERFDLAWKWAQDNIERPDGLLSFLWRDGQVVDPEAASDADLDAARALLLAADRFEDESYREDAVSIGEQVLAQETVEVGGEPLLVAGPWAREEPNTVNPSYFAPRSYAALGEATGDARFAALAESGRSLISDVSGEPLPLPPDWAEPDASGALQPAPSPGDGTSERYGFEATRIPIRFAESCEEEDREVAAELLPFYEQKLEEEDKIVISYDLEGKTLDGNEHPVPAIAAAASAHAAGDEGLRDELIARAEDLDERFPTYYGSAWVAIGRLMLTTDLLGEC